MQIKTDSQTGSGDPIPSAKPFPTKLQVEVTTRCNMRCAMCVKSAPNSDIPERDLELDDFKKMGEALTHCEALVLNGIGEPMLHPDLPEMAAYARERMPENGWIGFQTNGLLVTESLADKLVQAGVDTFCLSVDTLECGAACQGELHGQTEVDRLAQSLNRLREASRNHGRSIRLGVEFVLMHSNLDQLPGVVRWAGDHGAEFVIVSHVLAYDAAMEAQSLFNPNTPTATAIFEKWQAKARTEGVDLHDYAGLGWKFSKTTEEVRLARLVMDMQLEARDKGIWLYLQRLLEWDRRQASGEAETVARVFAEAEQLAEGYGIELRLPELMAADERRCHFVEEGVAFVTSSGDISPCQYLWHTYSCRLDGGDKNIKPWYFGNIAGQELGETWRGRPYADFRAEVLKYEYPYCSNCPFVPCDDITGTVRDFDYDCLGIEIPCGHCLWCMGGLKCLL